MEKTFLTGVAVLFLVTGTAQAHVEEVYVCNYISRSVAVPNLPPVPQAMRSLSLTIYDKDVVIQYPGMSAWKYPTRGPTHGGALVFSEMSAWVPKRKELLLGNESNMEIFKCEEAE